MDTTATQLAYEVYVEPFDVTAWKDGCIWRTASRGAGWHPKAVVDANRPAETGIIYAAASDEFANTHSTIRLARPATP